MIEPGLYTDLSSEDYHADDAIGSTDIRNWHEHKNLFYYYRKNPKPETKQMRLGRLVHSAVLEEGRFYKDHCAPPDVDRRYKEGKRIWAEFKERCKGKEHVEREIWEKVFQIKAAIEGHSKASNLIGNAEKEQSIFWIDRVTGIQCKCRPDAHGVANFGPYIVDIKTCGRTGEASQRGFGRSIERNNYHIQGAWYIEGFCQYFKHAQCSFIFIAVETNPPFMVGIHKLPERATYFGNQICHKALREMKEDFECPDNISGYSNDVEEPIFSNYFEREMESYT